MSDFLLSRQPSQSQQNHHHHHDHMSDITGDDDDDEYDLRSGLTEGNISQDLKLQWDDEEEDPPVLSYDEVAGRLLDKDPPSSIPTTTPTWQQQSQKQQQGSSLHHRRRRRRHEATIHPPETTMTTTTTTITTHPSDHADATAAAVTHGPVTPMATQRSSVFDPMMEEECHGPTFLSPFSSKASQQQQQQHSDGSKPNDSQPPSQQHQQPLQLSLHATRSVSIVVYVTNPTKMIQDPEHRIPCVFPANVALEGKLSETNKHAAVAVDSSEHDYSNHSEDECSHLGPPSPTTATLHATTHSKDLVIINPTAFGTTLPNHVSLDILNSLTRLITAQNNHHHGSSNTAAAIISSEDWVRLFRFHQVWWPRGRRAGLDRLAAAVAYDVTAPASIAQRVIVGMGGSNSSNHHHHNNSSSNNSNHTNTMTTRQLFGSVVHATVAQAFASTVAQTRNDMLDKYGILGRTIHHMGQHLPTTSQLTLSILQIIPGRSNANGQFTARAEIQDLLQTKSTPSTQAKISLQHISVAETGGYTNNHNTMVTGLTQAPIEANNLKAVGHLMRRAWLAATHPRRCPQRGHVVVTVRVYREARQLADESATIRNNTASFTLVDLAPTTPENPETARRDAAVRQTISVLGGVLRGNLLKAAGNQVAIPYRESLLTKVLQGFMDRPDSRTLLLAGISPLKDDYDRSMADLRYCSRIMEKPGETPKSPFDSLSKGTSPTSQMSHSTTASEQNRQRQIMMEQFDPKYYSALLRNVTADPRQRWNLASRQRVALASSDQDVEAYIPPDYMEIDPGAVPLKPLYDDLPGSLPVSKRPTGPPTASVPYSPAETGPQARLGINTTFTLDSMERGSLDEDDDQILLEDDTYGDHEPHANMSRYVEPSPLATFTGNDHDFGMAMQHQMPDEVETARVESPVEDTPLVSDIPSEDELPIPVETVEEEDILDNLPENNADLYPMKRPLDSTQVMPMLSHDESTNNAEMDALSLELRHRAGQPGTISSPSPDDAAMDDLSYELLHRDQQFIERPTALEALDESPIKEINTPSFADMEEEPVESTRFPHPSRLKYHYDDNDQLFQEQYNSKNSESVQPTPQHPQVRPQTQYTRQLADEPWRSLPQSDRVDTVEYHHVYHTEESHHSLIEKEHAGELRRIDSRSSSRPTSDHVDLTMYGVTPRAGRSLNSEEVVEPDETALIGSKMDIPASHRNLTGYPNRAVGATHSSDQFRQRYDDAFTDTFAKLPGSHQASEVRQTLTNAQAEASMEESLVPNRPSDGSETELEIEQIDSLIHKLRRSTRSSSQSISNDLNMIEHNQRSVVRRLVEERDSARRDVVYRTEEQRKESARRERELRELQANLEAVHAERRELEQIAEDAVTGREDLERRTVELERALKKHERESVSRKEYLLLKDECENMKKILEAKSHQLADFQSDLVEQRGSTNSLRIELQELEHAKADLESRLKNEKNAVDKMQLRNGKVQAELEGLRSQIRMLENERSIVQSQLESTRGNLQLSLDKKDGLARSLSEQLEQLQAQYHEQNAEISTMRMEVQTLTQERDELQSRLSNDKHIINTLEDKESKAQQELQSLRSHIRVLENEGHMVQSQMESTVRKLQLSLGEKDSYTKGLSAQLEQLQEDFQAHTSTISNLRIEIQTLTHEKTELHSHLNYEKSFVDKLHERNGKDVEELKMLRSQVIVLENERNLATSQMDSTQRSLQKSLDQKDSYIEKLTQQLEQLRAETQESQTQLWEQQELVTKLRQESSTGSERIEKLLRRIKELEEEVAYSNKLREELGQELSERLKEMKELSQALRQVTGERGQAETKLEEMEHQKQQAEERAKRVEEETKTFRDEARRRLRNFVDRHQENEALIKRQGSDMAALTRGKEELSRELEVARNENQSIRTTIQELKVQITQLSQTRMVFSEREQLEMQTLRDTNTELRTQIGELKDQLMDSERNYQLQLETERAELLRLEQEREVHRRAELERAERLRLDVERRVEEEREKIRRESEREALRQIELERERLRRESERETRHQVEAERKRLLLLDAQHQHQYSHAHEEQPDRLSSKIGRESRRRAEEDRKRLRFEAERLARHRADEERRRRRMLVTENGRSSTAMDDMGGRRLMDLERSEWTRNGSLTYQDRPEEDLYNSSGYRKRGASSPDSPDHDRDDYRRLEEVTVALAQALHHSSSQVDQDDVADLLRQFHAAEEAIVAHNRYFRSRIEGLRHTAGKR